MKRQRCADSTCGFIHYDNPLPVVAAIVQYEGDVILARNHGWPEHWFGLITGFLEKNETPEEAILSELKEELDLEGEVTELIGVYTFQRRKELIVAYHVFANGKIQLGAELASIKRVVPNQLKPWEFGTGLAVRDWLVSKGIQT